MTNLISILALLLLSISSADLGAEDANVMLRIHNDERTLSKLPTLVWDAGLGATASQWASTCPNGHSTDDLRKGASENLGWGWPMMNASAVVNDWIVEKADLVNDVCTPGKQCGHYQEIVSPNIGALGCATATNCPSSQVSGQSVMQVWVCHYGKSSGNTTTPEPATSANGTNSTAALPVNATTPTPTSAAAPGSSAMPATALPDSPAAMPFSKLIRRPIPIVNRYDSEPSTCDH